MASTDHRAELQSVAEAHGLGPTAIGRLLRVDESTVRRWLDGRRRCPPWAPRLLQLELAANDRDCA